MENLHIYEKSRTVPENALKEIKGGRLKGFSDINPMWRIKQLTELFGPCGVGWRYDVAAPRFVNGANGEVAVSVDIFLYYRHEGEWSAAIPGTGGSMFVAKESGGLRTNDEAVKMALTDAMGVACKALGFAADVYWEKDRTKYDLHAPATYEMAQKVFNVSGGGGEDDIKVDDLLPGLVDTGDKTDIVRHECEGCGQQMTQGQTMVSTKKYGRALCPTCQKEGK